MTVDDLNFGCVLRAYKKSKKAKSITTDAIGPSFYDEDVDNYRKRFVRAAEETLKSKGYFDRKTN